MSRLIFPLAILVFSFLTTNCSSSRMARIHGLSTSDPAIADASVARPQETTDIPMSLLKGDEASGEAPVAEATMIVPEEAPVSADPQISDAAPPVAGSTVAAASAMESNAEPQTVEIETGPVVSDFNPSPYFSLFTKTDGAKKADESPNEQKVEVKNSETPGE